MKLRSPKNKFRQMNQNHDPYFLLHSKYPSGLICITFYPILFVFNYMNSLYQKTNTWIHTLGLIIKHVKGIKVKHLYPVYKIPANSRLRKVRYMQCYCFWSRDSHSINKHIISRKCKDEMEMFLNILEESHYDLNHISNVVFLCM